MKPASLLISISKAARSFIFSMMAIITPYYLQSMHISALYVGIIIFISLVSGSVFILLYSRVPFSAKNRVLLLSVLMVAALTVLVFVRNVVIFVVAVFIGGISLAGRDFSAYPPIEKFAISSFETIQKDKNEAFSVYNFGSYGSAAIASAFLYLDLRYSFQEIFEILLVLSILQLILYIFVKLPDYKRESVNLRLPKNVKAHVNTLSYLFAIDAFGGGFVTVSMLTLWFKAVYHISLSEAGFIFIIVNVLTALSILVSSKISGKIGLIKTMVFTHIVSNFFLILMPLVPNLYAAELFLYLRQTTSQMDVPARDSFTNTIIPPGDRIKTNSVFTTVRTLGHGPGPAIGGYLIEAGPPSLLFVAGGVKILYDLLLYYKYHWFKD
ncbi:TVG1494892 [Thermoplasma volcanium GSS1]|uniref:TVG1494892 protein n=1 Tax=Thermoplasma volcanium (strain ATCC 51530 / DSM 4299 / JCM 9571 / NBRC 15438 / GSS1) TaxID=273116 RepID=Q978G9_THEVO|nr:MFS transporter [Thermoplasma volcanium]BAB60588.1 TVG1494892 [Thermoplasma volcanium GSS1]